MDILDKHEMFEMEVLDRLKSGRFLDPLVFVGGTMLRLCHELNRYSVDLDFWMVKKTSQESYLSALKKEMSGFYEVTDAFIKQFTILLEIRSPEYPQRLKIEIRKEVKDVESEDRIAYSYHSNRQVILKVQTLEGTMRSKVDAILSRKEIRDAFDIEFLLRKGVGMEGIDRSKLVAVKEITGNFKTNDLKVKLGSILDRETRKYYVTHGFEYLLARINAIIGS